LLGLATVQLTHWRFGGSIPLIITAVLWVAAECGPPQ